MIGLRRAKAGSLSLCLSACAGTLIALPAPAQPATPPLTAQPANPAFTGRDFAGLRFPLAPTPGPIAFSATRVHAWTDPAAALQPGEGPLQRLFLSGDVRVRLGVYEFEAANAVVWFQKIDDAADPQSPGVFQVFVYFDRLGDPTADAQNFAGVSVSADRLPVRGVIEAAGPIDLKADALRRERPNDKLVDEGEASLAKALRAVAGIPEPAPPGDDLAPISARGIRAPIAIAPPAGSEMARLLEDEPAPAAPSKPGPTPPVADRGSPRTEPRSPAPRATPPRQSPGATPPPMARTPAPSPQTPTQVAVQPGEPQAPIAPGPADLPSADRPFRPSAQPAPADQVAELLKSLPPADPSKPIFTRQGLIAVHPGNFQVISGPDENAVIADGGVSVQYTESSSLDTLQMTAQRAVIFLNPGPLSQYARFTQDQVRGIYLEGDVVASSTRGSSLQKQYTLRGPQMYYDVARGKAVVLDAVFWTYDAARRLPVYLRASTIRQEASNQFSAESARLANTAFFDPELALGATTLTLTRIERPLAGGGSGNGAGGGDPDGSVASGAGGASSRSSVYVDADDLTIRTSDLPFFYFPGYAGDPTTIPLKDIRIENSSDSGSAFKTTWNAMSLLGLEKTKDFDADLLLDAYFERGFAVGTNLEWGEPGGAGTYKGGLFGYMIFNDTGTDLTKPGIRIDRDGETRGIILAEHRWKLDDHWTFFGDASYIGDETFIDAFYEPFAENRREFTNRAYVRRLEENTALTIEGKGEFNDFIANEYLLQTPGYQTDKLPEVAYYRQSDDLLSGVAPGLLSYSSEYRLGRLSLNFDEPTAAERGFTSNFLSQRAFGINRNESIADRLRAQGYEEDGVYRADTRQELSSQLAVGPLNITPFAVGRFTFYDNDFQAFSPEEDDNARYWGGVGTRISTTLQRVDDSVDSRLFDLHRVRHIIEPGVTVMQSGTNVDRVNLPVYDDEIEGTSEGGLARLGVNQTWQTMRGGPGRWHSVDVFKLNTEAVFASGDTDRETPIGRFFEFRPENSVPGNYLNIDGLWQVSEVVALAGGSNYDLNLGQQSRNNFGVILEHTPQFRTFADVRYVNSQDNTYLIMGTSYEFEKYAVLMTANYDASQGGFQTIGAEVRRRSSAVVLGFNISYNDITGETGFGILLQPLGVQGGGARLRGLGGADRTQTSSFGGS